MKISPELYAGLKADIAAVAKAYNIDLAKADGGNTGLKTMWAILHEVSYNRAYDDNRPAFAQGRRRVLPYDGRAFTFYYADECKDEHVETALRRIKAELIAEQILVVEEVEELRSKGQEVDWAAVGPRLFDTLYKLEVQFGIGAYKTDPEMQQVMHDSVLAAIKLVKPDYANA